MQFGDELENIVLQFPMRQLGRGEQKCMVVTEKQIRNLCSLLLCFMETNVLWYHPFLEMMASSNIAFVYAKLTKLKDYIVVYFTSQMTFLRGLEWLVLHLEA